MERFNYDRVNAVLAKNAAEVRFEIQSYKPVGNGMFSIVAAITHIEASEDEINQAVAKMTEGRGRLLAGSYRQIPYTGVLLSRFIVAPNVNSKAYTAENTKGMKTITANVMADENNNIWRVVGENDDKRLVMQSEDNMESLLQNRQARLQISASIQHEVEFANGDYVAFANPITGEIGYGFGFKSEGSLCVYDRELNSVVRNISAGQVVEALAGIEEEVVAAVEGEEYPIDAFNAVANLSSAEADKAVAYFRKVYSSKPELMAKWESLISNMKGKSQNLFVFKNVNQEVKVAMDGGKHSTFQSKSLNKDKNGTV